MISVGILNCFWFGLLPAVKDVGFHHQPADDLRLGKVVRTLNVDLMAFIEIVDVERLERLLRELPGQWRLRDNLGQALCSAAPGHQPDYLQRVVVAWNDDVLELVQWGREIEASPRRPVVARLRNRMTQGELTVVAIHPKSGQLRGWEQLPADHDAHKSGLKRREQFQALATWFHAPPPQFAGSSVLLGDFNAVADSSEVEPVRFLPGWQWPTPSFRPPNADRCTTKTDPGEIIDHAVLSPDLGFSEHRALAFDLLDEYENGVPAAHAVWKRTTDHRAVRLSLDV